MKEQRSKSRLIWEENMVLGLFLLQSFLCSSGPNVSVGPEKLISEEVAPNVAVDLFSQYILTSPNEQLIQSISESALSLGIFTFTKQISSKMSQISTIGSEGPRRRSSKQAAPMS